MKLNKGWRYNNKKGMNYEIAQIYSSSSPLSSDSSSSSSSQSSSSLILCRLHPDGSLQTLKLFHRMWLYKRVFDTCCERNRGGPRHAILFGLSNSSRLPLIFNFVSSITCFTVLPDLAAIWAISEAFS